MLTVNMTDPIWWLIIICAIPTVLFFIHLIGKAFGSGMALSWFRTKELFEDKNKNNNKEESNKL